MEDIAALINVGGRAITGNGGERLENRGTLIFEPS